MIKQKKYSFQLDVLKAFAIICVVLVHTLPRDILLISQAQFHMWQAVLIFIFLLGYNWGASYLRTENFWIFVINRIKRLAVPLIIFSLITMFFQSNLSFDYALFLGVPPFRGAGSYFIALIIQLTLIIPLMIMLYKRTTMKVFLFTFFILNLLIELVSPYIFNSLPSIYYSGFSLRYIFVVALGITFIDNKDNFLSVPFIKIGLIMSLLYLAYWGYNPFYPPFVIQKWSWQHLFAFFYTGAFVYIFIKSLSQTFNRQSILIIGKSSFHIFLLQIIFFGLGGTKELLRIIGDIGLSGYLLYGLVLCFTLLLNIGLGVLWYFIEKKFVWRK